MHLLLDESDTATVRARKGDAKRGGGGIPSYYILIMHCNIIVGTTSTPSQRTGIDETGSEETMSYWPAVKGIGGVMVVSLIIWFICMFVYSMPVGMQLVM